MRSIVVVDSETDLIKPCPERPGAGPDKVPRLVCVSYAYQGGKGLLDVTEAEPFLRMLLGRDDVTLALHNAAFDMSVFFRAFPHLVTPIFRAYEDGKITCTKNRQKLLDLAEGTLDNQKRPRPDRVKGRAYSLEALMKRHFGKRLDKDTWRLKYWEMLQEYGSVHRMPEGAQAYALGDAVDTLDLCLRQGEGQVSPDEYKQACHDFWLYQVTARGIATDVPRLNRLADAVQQEIDRYASLLIEARLLRKEKGKYVRCVKNAQGMIEAAYAALGQEVPKTDPSDTYEDGQTQADTVACEKSGDPLLVLYARYLKLAGILTKDIASLAAYGSVHPSFNSLLETGRTSSGGNKKTAGYNTQNPARGLPKFLKGLQGGIRECFVARPGYVLIDSDYDGLELRTMAQACLWLVGQSSLAPLLNAGEDPHLEMAASMAGISYAEAKVLYRELQEYEAHRTQTCSSEAKHIGECRQNSKPANFGFPGGMAKPETFIDYCEKQGTPMTAELALHLLHIWRQVRPEFPSLYLPLHGRMVHEAQAQGLRGASIEAFISGRIRGGCSYTEANNNRFQALGADASKAAGWRLVRSCLDPSLASSLFGSYVVNYVHDQFHVETPDNASTLDDCAKEVQRIMQEEATRYLPDVPATTTPCASRCWSKKAKSVYDANGRLTVWEEA